MYKENSHLFCLLNRKVNKLTLPHESIPDADQQHISIQIVSLADGGGVTDCRSCGTRKDDVEKWNDLCYDNPVNTNIVLQKEKET